MHFGITDKPTASDTSAVFCASRLCLGSSPLLFLLYTAELTELAARFGVTLHAFADDNQLYLSCRTNDAHLLWRLLSAV